MMHLFRKSCVVMLIAFWQCLSMQGQSVENNISMSIPEISLITFEGGEQIITHSTQLEGKGQINQIITPPVQDTWINYASIVKEGAANEITVHISSGYLPPDIKVKVLPNQYSGTGEGMHGNPANEVILSRNPKPIITNIGSCFTGKGANNGHKLVYVWEGLDNYDPEVLKRRNYSITVTYTIKTSK